MSKEIQIFTDGSSINSGEEKGLGGWGAILIHSEKPDEEQVKIQYASNEYTMEIFGSELNTTNQRMEMKAVIEGLKRVKNTKIPINVYSDSSYFINGMNEKWYSKWRMNGWKNSKKEPVANKDLWEEVLQVIEDGFLNVTFNKVKGHSGVFYNEACDGLARQGLEEAREMVRNV